MAFKNSIDLAKAIINDKAGFPNYYYDKNLIESYDNILHDLLFGIDNYENDRKEGTRRLKQHYATLKDNEINDILDSYVTRKSHYNEGGTPTKVGRFETGVDYYDAQNRARDLLRENKEADGVVYGLYAKDLDDPYGKTSGLKNPIVVHDTNDYAKLNQSLIDGNKNQKLFFNTLYRHDLED